MGSDFIPEVFATERIFCRELVHRRTSIAVDKIGFANEAELLENLAAAQTAGDIYMKKIEILKEENSALEKEIKILISKAESTEHKE